jgi:hypothetical protein
MSGWEIFGIVIGLLIAGFVLYNLRDLCRYIKISRM